MKGVVAGAQTGLEKSGGVFPTVRIGRLESRFVVLQIAAERLDATRVVETIRSRECDLVITAGRAEVWRGVPQIDRALHEASAAAEVPQCAFG